MKLSVITINYNNCAGLERTIKSVLAQSLNDFEYIIIDGASTDGSAELIKKNSAKLGYAVSEPDKGIYNAMNKGITNAKGEYLLFLNSGDYFIHPEILQSVFHHLDGTEIVYGDGLSEVKGSLQKVFIPSELKLDYFSANSLCHPSSFIKKDLFTRFGLYNEENKIVSDWEFFIKTIMVNDVSVIKIPYEISVVEDNGISRDIANAALLQQEVKSVLSRYFPPSVIKLISEYKALKSEMESVKADNSKQSTRDKIIFKIKKNIKLWKGQK